MQVLIAWLTDSYHWDAVLTGIVITMMILLTSPLCRPKPRK